MRTKLAIGLALLAVVLIITDAAKAQKAGQTGQVKVKVGETKVHNTSEVRFRFVSVVEDSRCPEDVACIWAGRAVIRLGVKAPGKAEQTVELSTMEAEQTKEIGGYKVTLVGVAPYPKAEKPIGPNDYTASLSVEKAKASSAEKNEAPKFMCKPTDVRTGSPRK